MKYNLLVVVAVAYLLGVIWIAHFFAPPAYTWTTNTVSELAAQGSPNAWIMQVGLTGFGILLCIAIVQCWAECGRIYPPDIPLLVYGIAILASGVFSAAPIDPAQPYSAFEAGLHSVMATLAGIALSAAIGWRMWLAPRVSYRIFHLVMLLLVFGLSLLFGLSENGVLALPLGVVQRLLYLAGLGWLAAVPWLCPLGGMGAQQAGEADFSLRSK